MIKTALFLSLLMVCASAFQLNMKFSFGPKKSAPAPAPVPAAKPAAKSPFGSFGKKAAAPAPVPAKKAAAPAPAKKAAPAPAKKAAPAPVKKAAPAPVKRSVPSNSGSVPAIFLTGYPSGYKSTGAPVSSFAGGLVGADVEAGEFDPWKLSQGVSTETLNWYRAAELKVNPFFLINNNNNFTLYIKK